MRKKRANIIKPIEKKMNSKIQACICTNPEEHVDSNHSKKQCEVTDYTEYIAQLMKKKEIFVYQSKFLFLNIKVYFFEKENIISFINLGVVPEIMR